MAYWVKQKTAYWVKQFKLNRPSSIQRGSIRCNTLIIDTALESSSWICFRNSQGPISDENYEKVPRSKRLKFYKQFFICIDSIILDYGCSRLIINARKPLLDLLQKLPGTNFRQKLWKMLKGRGHFKSFSCNQSILIGKSLKSYVGVPFERKNSRALRHSTKRVKNPGPHRYINLP